MIIYEHIIKGIDIKISMDQIDMEKNMGMDKFIIMHMKWELLWLLYYYRHIHIPCHGPGLDCLKTPGDCLLGHSK